ncbi:MAG: pentapeptide repeat-containing protein [Enterobacterales bacterium]|uniref:pentapeptide repeat-containing protein n=1 Tax=Serratia sp. (in: enterobacteria) TaxID=616 RepID=UPI003F2B35B6
MKELGSLRGIGEHLIYLFTFGQVDRGRERLEMFTKLAGNLVSLGSKDGALACQFRDPDNEDQLIRITIWKNQIHAEVINTKIRVVEKSDDLFADINTSHAKMTGLLLKLYRDITGKTNDASMGCRVNEDGTDLQGVNLEGVDLPGAHLEGADLRKANMSHLYLAGVHLEGADLRKADLWGSSLERADLRKADLRGTVLDWASMAGAKLAGAKISRENYDWAKAHGAYVDGAIICPPEE